jgi:hypothetical protein
MPRKTPKSDASPPPAAPVIPAAPPDAKASSGHSHAHLPHIDGFLQKIKQRNVGRVAILYIVVSYLILEPFEMFFHLLDLPVWTGRTAVALVVLGFPVALLFAWLYEVTPTGIKPSTEIDPQQSIARQTGRKLDYAIISVLAVALVYFVVDKFWTKRIAVVTPAATLAVAPAAVSARASAVNPVIPEKIGGGAAICRYEREERSGVFFRRIVGRAHRHADESPGSAGTGTYIVFLL